MRWIYHYSAQFQAWGSLVNMDGIANLGWPVRDMDGYRALKELIVKGEKATAESVSINSLTLMETGDFDPRTAEKTSEPNSTEARKK